MVRSWTTPIIGFILLVIGMLIGYAGRPAVEAQLFRAAANATPPAAANASTSQSSLMDSLIAQTRHFKGDPQAPVTIIEFSDFQ